MPIEASSTGHEHFDAVIADLRAELANLDQQASRIRAMVELLEEKAATRRPIRTLGAAMSATVSVAASVIANVAPPSPIGLRQAGTNAISVGSLAGLGLGDACLAAIAALGGRATNHEIVSHLQKGGYTMKSDNPLNNVGTGLNHRSKNRGDVVREGRHWVLKKSESPAVNEASHMNGATAVQPA